MLGQCDCWYEKIYSYLLKMAMVLSWNIASALRKGSLEESSISSPKTGFQPSLPLVALLLRVCVWDRSDILIWCERLLCELLWKTSHRLWGSIECSAWTVLHWFSYLFKNRRDFIFSDLAGIILCITYSNSSTKNFNLLRKGYFILSRNASADSYIQEAFRFSFVIISLCARKCASKKHLWAVLCHQPFEALGKCIEINRESYLIGNCTASGCLLRAILFSGMRWEREKKLARN